ncbi:MAG: hypothetical protein JNM55_02340 [Anaerolineales bacterium]|nr:hypothetical protein [Anaerolineales bacterium]
MKKYDNCHHNLWDSPAFVIILFMLQRTARALEFLLIFFIFSAILAYSNPSLTDDIERVRTYTRDIEFNYITWTVDAALLKLKTSSIGAPHILDRETQKLIVTEYLRTTQSIVAKESTLQEIYADPAIMDKESASADLLANLDREYKRQMDLAPFAEAVLQEQVSEVLEEIGLTTLGQPIPSLLFHSTPLPDALIVSKRDKIEQIANISLDPNITVDQQAALEAQIDKDLDTSSLVVQIGGVGVYPTMVMRTTDLPWLLNTISHEWTHNYLTLRPLGFLYTADPTLRTMNETTASIAGDEIGALVLKKFYPELANASPIIPGLISAPFDHPEPGDFLRPPFDFRAEMYITRTGADALLAEGKIDEAEAYMESRRQIFLKHGYLLRKINQAYFAFYGAYADSPGGAAGEDPVGPAVRELRAQSDSLTDFLNTISWMYEFEQLQEAIQK